MMYQWICDAPPGQIAVVDGERSITYGELAEGTRHRMDAMAKGGLCVVDDMRPIEFIKCMAAALHVGRGVFPVLPSLSPNSKARLLTTLMNYPDQQEWNEGDLLSLTSGSCGASKIVVRPIDNLVDEAIAVGEHLGLDGDSKVCVMTPLAHSFGCGLWRTVLWAGGTLYVSGADHINNRLSDFRCALDHGTDFLFGVPYLFQVLARHGVKNSNRELRCFAGGETLTGTTFLSWKAATGLELKQEYGLSEGGITTLANPDTPFRSIGVPIPGVEIKIDKPDAAGIGEMVVYRPGAPSRYLFEGMGDTFQEDGGIRTGDLGCFDPVRGEYYFAGRLKSVIVVAGLKMVPQEVEDAIRKHPWVEDVAVIGVPDALTGERPVAYVSSKSGEGMTGEIREMLKADLDSYKVPKRIVLVDSLPRTPSGKVDRNALTKL